MPTTCLICFQQAQYFILPPCNHKEMCWKCCIKLVDQGTFTCPYCNGTPEGISSILFVNEEEMKNSTFQQILNNKPFKSSTKHYHLYSNENVARFIEEQTSFFCRLCSSVFNNMNFLKKHLNQVHRKQFCDQCLENRKCLLSEQYLYSEGQLTAHLKKGEYSHENELILYHPWCDFCKSRFYDIDAFRAHLRISTHLKCQICQRNYPKLKYVYYKDYNQIQKHFYKSHFVCDIGACIGNKLQNVFVSQHLLEQHKNRFHGKVGSKAQHKPIVNLLLFQQNLDEEFQWDRIGKDFSKEFMIAEKSYTLHNQEHKDTIIDIRAFYPELTKAFQRASLDQIQERLSQYLFRSDFKSESVNFTSVPIFCPLEMTSVTRFELQKFIRNIYEPKYSEPIIQIFFTRKFEYRSQSEYFSDVRRKMWLFSPISYYYVFPQLVRFFKDTNRTKITMDQYYAQSLRSLKINRFFIFHTKERYTDILNIMQDQVEQYIYEQMIEQQINLSSYQKYLKDLNPQYYHTVHSQLFYVQKQKIKNMFHMIEKTKTNELLKLNWLLKLGLSNESFKAIYDHFFYKTVEDCNGWMRCITLQELALVYAYVEICLISFIDKTAFNANKSNPHTLFLGSILSKIKTCISAKQLSSLRQLQQKSIELSAKLNSFAFNNKKKGVVVNQEDHPSLLTPGQDQDKKIEDNLFLFGQNVSIRSNTNIRVNKKNNKITEDAEEFPELFVNKKKLENTKMTEEQQFPVFNYQHKERPQDNTKNSKKRKVEDEQKTNIEKLQLFNPKNAFVSQKICEEFYENKQKKNKSSIAQTKDDDQWPKLGNKSEVQMEEINKQKNTKKKKKKEAEPVQEVVPQKEESPQIPEQVLIKKKTKEELKAQQQQGKLKKIKQKVAQQYLQEPQKPAENEQKTVKKEQTVEQVVPKKKKRKMRLDATDSQDEERRQKQQKLKLKEQKYKAFMEQQKLKETLKYHQGFDSLLQNKNKTKGNNVSIINSLINQNKTAEVQTEIVVKKGKKGKAIVIEKVDFWKL